MIRAGKIISVVLGLLNLQVVAPTWLESRRFDEIRSGDMGSGDMGVENQEAILSWLIADGLFSSESTPFAIVGKPTAQSSTFLEYTSDKAADGNEETNLYPNFMCACTKEQANPWWRVDLGGKHCIDGVIILNRGDCCSYRLTNAVIRVGNSPTVTDNKACGSPVTSKEAGVSGGFVGRVCPSLARYVSVDIRSEVPIFLQLCEVTVKELPVNRCWTR